MGTPGELVRNTESLSSCCGSEYKSLTSIHEEMGLIPCLDQWVKGVDLGCGLDMALLWLWYRLAAAVFWFLFFFPVFLGHSCSNTEVPRLGVELEVLSLAQGHSNP